MAKKKKNSRDEFDGMLMSELDNMLSSLSPDMQAQLLKGMYDMMGDGKDMINIQNESYEYQRPDYAKDAQPLAECLVNLPNAAKPSEALAEYAHIHSVMEELSKEENEQMLRNYLMNVLADGLTHDFQNEKEKSGLPLFVVFQLVDDFQLTGLFDVILETLKQAPNFFQFYYGSFEDVATLILARVGTEHLDELKEIMKVDVFVAEVYPIVFNAVVQMAVENPSCRLKVLTWVANVLKSCLETTIPIMAMDWTVMSLAQIKAVELLPMFKDIYKVCDVPPIEIKNGIKGVTKLLTKGTDEQIVDFTSFKEMLERLQEGEDSDFESFDPFGDLGIWGDSDDEDEWNDDDWADWDDWEDSKEARDREAKALFYKELNQSKKKK